MDKKNVLKSKTFWVAIAMLLLTILTGLVDVIGAKWAMTAATIIMLILRTFTTQAVEWKFW